MKNFTSIIPKPNSIKKAKGSFYLKSHDTVSCSNKSSNACQFLCEYLGLKEADDGKIQLLIDDKIKNQEGYKLDISNNSIKITASSDEGLFYGVQTLRQLLPENIETHKITDDIRLPNLTIEDEPRFSYRGFMFDSSRHFFSVSTIKRIIDLIAMLKLNRFHWHLTDDQGFRIDIKKYPQLTKIGSMRKRSQTKGFLRNNSQEFNNTQHGGYYTKEDICEVVDYAKKHCIEVIPEVDFPGHTVAILAAYPEFSCTGGPFEVADRWGVIDDVFCIGNEKAVEFAIDLLLETAKLFSYNHIHIGGDEAPTIRWQKCKKCQEKMKQEGLKDEKQLQTYFTNRVLKELKKHGYTAIAWNEVLNDDLDRDVINQYWLMEGKKETRRHLKKGRKTIFSPFSKYYLDYSYSLLPLNKSYNYNPHFASLQKEATSNIIGVEAPLWTEWIDNENRIDWQMFPRITALCETAWTKKDLKSYDDYLYRLSNLEKRLDVLGVNYCTRDCYLHSKKTSSSKMKNNTDHISNIEYNKYHDKNKQ